MLILTRRLGERLRIGENVVITILGVKGHQIRLGIDAPRHVVVDREEIYQRKHSRHRLRCGPDSHGDLDDGAVA